jgi:Tfp pilus assembly protein PilN
MNIQVNLLPEARIHKLRNQAKKRSYATIAGVAGGITLAAIIVFVMLQGFLMATYRINKTRISDLNKELESSRDLEKSATTLQNNLASFYRLDQNRTYASRIFTNFYNLLPGNITINSLQIDDKDIVTVSGTTNSFTSVSKFAETLDEYNVNFLPQDGLPREPIFSDATISSVSKDANSGRTNFSMTFKVNQKLIKQQADK